MTELISLLPRTEYNHIKEREERRARVIRGLEIIATVGTLVGAGLLTAWLIVNSEPSYQDSLSYLNETRPAYQACRVA